MSESTHSSNPQAHLRHHAEAHLRSRTAPAGRGWPVSIDALQLLHDLAGAPDSAADALKLLHELQVHQVELDLQQEQVEAVEMERIREVERYRALFDFLPVACLMLDAAGAVVEANLLAGELLQASPAQLAGRQVADFFAADQRAELQFGLAELRQQTLDVRCRLATDRGATGAAGLRMRARRMPGAEAILVTLAEREPAQKSP